MKPLLIVAALGLTACFVVGPGGPTSGGSPVGGGPPVVVGSGPYFTLVLDQVDLDPSFGSGYPPAIYVTVLVGGQTASSAELDGSFDPVWNDPLMAADQASFEDGVDVQVWADDGSGPALAGEVSWAPSPDEFGAPSIDLGAFDYIQDAVFELQPQ